MPLRKLPEKDTPEAEKLIAEYTVCSPERLQELADKFEYKSVQSFMSSMHKTLGAKRLGVTPELEEPPVQYIPYPEIKLKPFKAPKTSRDEEDFNLVIADPHIDKITENYNLEIAQDRFEVLLDSVMTILNLHRPIGKVNIFMLGDIVQGENIYQGSKQDQISRGVFDQIHEHAVPIFARFCTSLAQGVSAIDVYGVRGNHGRYSREAPDKTNWDRFFYKALADGMVNQKSVNVYPAREFYQLVNDKGFRFFLIHGDQARGNAGVPAIALRRKMQEWYAYVGGFNYAYCGHFHTGGYDQINTVADYTICPPLVTGDEWALERVGRASEPRQLCFGVHSRYGRTFEYKLHTDNKFLPRKFDEPEGEVRLT